MPVLDILLPMLLLSASFKSPASSRVLSALLPFHQKRHGVPPQRHNHVQQSLEGGCWKWRLECMQEAASLSPAGSYHWVQGWPAHESVGGNSSGCLIGILFVKFWLAGAVRWLAARNLLRWSQGSGQILPPTTTTPALNVGWLRIYIAFLFYAWSTRVCLYLCYVLYCVCGTRGVSGVSMLCPLLCLWY